MNRDFGRVKYFLIATALIFFAVVVFAMPAVAEEYVSSPQIPSELTDKSDTYQAKFASEISTAVEEDNPVIRNYARMRVDVMNSGPNYTVAKACDMYDYVNLRWQILSEPRGPFHVASATETIRSGLRGSGDDYSAFLSSLIGSLDGDMRIIISISPDYEYHIFPEVFIGSGEDEVMDNLRYVAGRYGCDKVWYTKDTTGGVNAYWLNLDWVVDGMHTADYYRYGNSLFEINTYHPGRSYISTGTVTIVYPDGKWKDTTLKHGYYQKVKGVEKLYE